MKIKVKNLLFLAVAVILLSVAFAVVAFGETLNSNIYTSEVKANFKGFDGKTVSSPANFNWKSTNGAAITRTPVRYLPAYALSVNAPAASEVKASFSSVPTQAVDFASCGRVYFAVRYETTDNNVKYNMRVRLENAEDAFVSTAVLSGNSWQLVSFEVGVFSSGTDVTAAYVEFSSNTKTKGKILMAGPYKIEPDRTYEDLFCLGDVNFSDEARGTEQGIVIKESSQKVGFSGRYLPPDRKTGTNYLRVFITTGSVGGNLEMRYGYLNSENGRLTTESYTLGLENGKENNSYIIPLKNADRIITLSFLFDAARIGDITVHGIEAVGIYSSADRVLYGEITDCSYTVSDGIINIRGNIFHNFLIKHDSFELLCFRLGVGETLQDAVNNGDEPVASSKMSSEFKMTYKAGRQDKTAAVSRYTVVAGDGKEFIEILPPFYIDMKSSATDSDSSDFKGIYISPEADITSGGAGVTVVDVYLDKLTNTGNSGYLYSIEGNHVYYSSDYVSRLDSRIKDLCASGCAVYLRLLIGQNRENVYLPYARTSDKDALYYAIELKSEEAMLHLFSAVDFLSSRYSEHSRGSIAGYILGTSLNFPDIYNFGVSSTLADYAAELALTMEIISHTAALSLPTVRMILPVSDRDASDKGYDPELLLTSVCNRLDEYGGLEFTVMLESSDFDFSSEKHSYSTSPYITDEGGMIIPDPTLVIRSTATVRDIGFEENIAVFEQMLGLLNKRSESVSQRYFYFWTPPRTASNSAVISAYIYTYYRFLFADSAEAFILSLDGIDNDMLLQLFKYIDTKNNKNGELVSFILPLYNASEWSELFPEYDRELIPERVADIRRGTDEVDHIGRFYLFDFKSSFGTLDWFMSSGCKSLAIGSSNGEKALCAVMNGKGEHAEIAYCFEYPEKLGFAPYMNFSFSVGESSDEKYSVKITVISGKNILEATEIFSGGEINVFTLDLNNILPESGIDSVRICIDRTSESEDDYIFSLFDVSVLSEALTDAELTERIRISRDEIKSDLPEAPVSSDTNGDDGKTPDYEFALILAAVLLVFVIVAGIYDRNKEH